MKRLSHIISAILITALLLTGACTSSAAKTYGYLLGDTDMDRDISVTDATLIQRRAAEMIMLSGVGKLAADVDSDGEIAVLDATAVQMWLADMRVGYPVGQAVSTTTDTVSPEPVISDDGKSVTVGDVVFDVSRIPTSVTIDDNTKNLMANLILEPKSEINPYDITVIVNHGMYHNRMDYSDPRFKDSYLMAEETTILQGYDCTIVDDAGNEVACVDAHYRGNYALPFQYSVYCVREAHCSFPVDIYYKDQLIRSTTVNINTSSGPSSLESRRAKVKEIEGKCWTASMTDEKKIQAFVRYISSNYSYSQVMCVTGAVYTAWAARDLGLNCMLLYPGGEPNQSCDRHIVTYDIYYNVAVPGGHCACLIEYEDGWMRYDVQGGYSCYRTYTGFQ